MIMLGVLVSGSGTNLQAILDAVGSAALDARVAVVVSNVADAKGLERARSAGVEAIVVDHKRFADRRAFDQAVVDVLRERGVECVVLAGFMRLLTPVLLDAFPMRIVNVHPALLPAFPGINAQRQALDVRRPRHGLHGALRRPRDRHRPDHRAGRGARCSKTTTRRRSRRASSPNEHELLPQALRSIARGRVTIGSRRRARARACAYARSPSADVQALDVTILGAGIGALTAAALLARRSWRVLVLGQGSRPPTYQYDGVTLARRPFAFLSARRRRGAASS